MGMKNGHGMPEKDLKFDLVSGWTLCIIATCSLFLAAFGRVKKCSFSLSFCLTSDGRRGGHNRSRAENKRERRVIRP